MLQEEELDQLDVLAYQMDSETEFGLRAKWWLESMKAFVERARLRECGPTDMESKTGDIIMCRKAEGPRWHGASFDLTTKCCETVAVAAGRARPVNVSEILSHMVFGR